MGKPVVITQDNFESEVLQASEPVLVDFWATWCGPCHAVAPVIEKLADDYAGRAKVCKCDVDANQPLAQQFDIRAIPTLLVFSGGKVVDRVVGVPSGAKVLSEKLDALL